MRIASLTAIAPLLLVTAATLSEPAFATDAQQALEMCFKRGPDCSAHMNQDGSHSIVVQNSDGPRNIECPTAGPCFVAYAKGVTKGKGATVGSVLRRPILGALPQKQGTGSSTKRTPVRLNSQTVERSGTGGSNSHGSGGKSK